MNKIPIDKIYHFIAGFMITLIVSCILEPVMGLVAGVSAGVLKEAYDKYSYNGADFFDLFATVVGSMVAVIGYLVWIRL